MPLNFRAASCPSISFRAASVAALCAGLAACGGGGGSDPAPAATLGLTGTGASGAAIAGGTVDARCAVGSGTATTATDGSYSIVITGGALPCVLRVTSGANVFHSVATGSGGTARANLTPITDLVVARLAGGLPAAYFAAFVAATATSLTSAGAQAAAASVIDALRGSGVDFTAAGDVLAGTLVASHTGVTGNAYDAALDALRAALASSGTTHAALTQTVALGSPAAPAAALSTVASLPAERLLARAATNCDALRSGRYRIVVAENGGTAPSTGLLDIDAQTLVVIDGGERSTLLPNGPCSYTTATGGELVVTKAGIAAARVGGNLDALQHGALLFAEQSHAVSELAGEWNAMQFDENTTTPALHPVSLSATIDATGHVTAITYCNDLKICTPLTGTALPTITFTASTSGGFNVANSSTGATHRAFAYRAGGGELMMVEASADGRLSFSTRRAAGVLPAVGRFQSVWNIVMTAQGVSTAAINKTDTTIVSVDVAAGSLVRRSVQNFTTGATRPEALQINTPRDGLTHRTPGLVTHSDGASSVVNEFSSLVLRGMDLSVVALPAPNQLILSPVQTTVTP